VLLHICRAFGGRRVKSIGDALLMTFRSPTDAVRSAMAMQNALERLRRSQPELGLLHVRAAINVGEVRAEFRDVFGEAVNLASRLQALTPSDAIYFTEAVYLAMNKAEVPSEIVGTRKIRGMPEPVRIYCVPSHRVHRLVPADGGLHDAGTDLPYADVPVPVRFVDASMEAARRRLADAGARLAPAWRATATVAARINGPARWMVVTIASIAIVLALTLYVPLDRVDASHVPASSAFGEVVEHGESLLLAKDLEELKRLIDERLQADGRDAAALLLRGHLAFVQGRPLNGVADYNTALGADPALQGNPRLVRNLVALLEREPAVMKTVALQLRELGHPERIDRFGYAIQELEGRSDCEDRLVAVRELRLLRDPRAIPHLEKALSGGVTAWFRQNCLRIEAQATLDELRGRQKS
jgi:hypothetical protein